MANETIDRILRIPGVRWQHMFACAFAQSVEAEALKAGDMPEDLADALGAIEAIAENTGVSRRAVLAQRFLVMMGMGSALPGPVADALGVFFSWLLPWTSYSGGYGKVKTATKAIVLFLLQLGA
jgi:hypothetical protein